MRCPKCGTENRPGARFCIGCGAPLPVDAESETYAPPSPPVSYQPAGVGVGTPAAPVSVPRRFPILRVLSVIYKVLGGIVAAITLLGSLGFCAFGFAGGPMLRGLERQLGMPLPQEGGAVAGVITAIIVLLYGGFAALTLYGAGEGISLFIAIEENTRMMAMSGRQ